MSFAATRRLAGALTALLASCALGVAPAQAAGLLGVSVGGKQVLEVSLASEGQAGKPAIGVSALSSTPEGQVQVAGVSVGGKPVVEVNTSTTTTTPAVEATTPVLTVSTPTASVPSKAPTVTETSDGGSSSKHPTATTAASAGAPSASPSASEATEAASAGHPSSSIGTPASRRPHARTATRKPAASGATVPAAAGRVASGGQAKAGSDAGVRASRAKRSSGNALSSLGSSLPLPLPVPDWSKPIILALVLLALAMWLRSRFALRKARSLEGRQEVLLRDMHAMQAALVPEIAPVIAGLGVSVSYRPAEGPAAGGDFYDVFLRGREQVAIILGDVAGHGHDALKQAALMRYTLRTYMQTASSPRAALALAGRALATPECEQLATVAAAIYDRRKGTLTYALAGHPAPIVTGLQIAESPLCCSSPPLGWDVPTGLRERTISLPDGASACFFSDGLIEARVVPGRGCEGLLGRERLRELLAAQGSGEGSPELLARIRAEAQATPDDMAACILTARESAPARHIDVEELELDEHGVQGTHLQSFLESCGLRQVEVERAVRRARVEVGANERALLIVDRSRGTVRATVKPIARQERGEPERSSTASALTGTGALGQS